MVEVVLYGQALVPPSARQSMARFIAGALASTVTVVVETREVPDEPRGRRLLDMRGDVPDGLTARICDRVTAETGLRAYGERIGDRVWRLFVNPKGPGDQALGGPT